MVFFIDFELVQFHTMFGSFLCCGRTGDVTGRGWVGITVPEGRKKVSPWREPRGSTSKMYQPRTWRQKSGTPSLTAAAR